MNDQRFYSLRELEFATDEACVHAMREWSAGRLNDAVNWAGLGCRHARQWFDQHGDRGFTVYIEEASPDASALRTFVRAHLRGKGFEGVEIVTEW